MITENKNFNNKRFQYNLKIIQKLLQEVVEHPDWRFNQLLYNLKIINTDNTDTFYLESKKVYYKLLYACGEITKEQLKDFLELS